MPRLRTTITIKKSNVTKCNTLCPVDYTIMAVLQNWFSSFLTPEKTPWPESASELHRLSDRLLSAKLVPTSALTGCNVVCVTDPYGRIFAFLDRSRYFFFQATPQLYSRGWVDRGPLLLIKFGSSGNRTRISGSVARNSHLIGPKYLPWVYYQKHAIPYTGIQHKRNDKSS
jgi:hypothetical protein